MVVYIQEMGRRMSCGVEEESKSSSPLFQSGGTRGLAGPWGRRAHVGMLVRGCAFEAGVLNFHLMSFPFIWEWKEEFAPCPSVSSNSREHTTSVSQAMPVDLNLEAERHSYL